MEYDDENDPGCEKDLLERMYKFYKENQLCNVHLVVGENRFRAHGLILAKKCEYLKNRLEGDPSEIIIEDSENILPETVKNAIEYFYLGKLDLTPNQAVNIIEFSKLIHYPELEEHCLWHLENSLNNSNFLFIEEFAKRRGYTELLELTKNYITNNYLEIIQSEEFLNMSCDRLCELLRSDDLKVKAEEEVFEGLSLWVQKDLEHRKKHLDVLLKCIRLPLLPTQFLFGKVKQLCYDSMSSCILWNLLEWHLNSDKRSSLTLLNSQPRKNVKSAQSILIVGGEMTTDAGIIETCNENNECSIFYQFNTQIVKFAAVALEDKLIMFGGQIKGSITNRVLSLDLVTKELTELEPMQQKRTWFAGTIADGQVFALGGYCNKPQKALNSVEKFDMSTNTWTFVKPMLTARSWHSVVVIGGEIYVIGGRDNNNKILDTVEVYNIQENKWKLAPVMSEARHCFAAVAMGNHIYVIGGTIGNGYNSTDLVERFNIKTQTWNSVASFPRCLDGLKAIVINDKIVCMGGILYSSLYVYDPKLNKWMLYEEVSKLRSDFNMLLVPSELLKIE